MLMCMYMLTKRANILFTENVWEQLTSRARGQKTSVGELVRNAVEEKYSLEQEFENRQRAFNEIMKMRQKYRKSQLNKKKKESVVALIKRMRKERENHIWKLLNQK